MDEAVKMRPDAIWIVARDASRWAWRVPGGADFPTLVSRGALLDVIRRAGLKMPSDTTSVGMMIDDPNGLAWPADMIRRGRDFVWRMGQLYERVDGLERHLQAGEGESLDLFVAAEDEALALPRL